MEIQEYLEKILQKYSISEDSSEVASLQSEKAKVEKILRDKFKESSICIQYAGSYKKGTMIKQSYDLDITCYFNRDDSSAGKTLDEIYSNVKSVLSKTYQTEEKKSAIRLYNNEGADFHIDVVPGRFIDDTKEDVNIHQFIGDKEWLKTNLNKHISHIKDSGLVNIIKLIKIWKEINGLKNIKTFILELLVIKVLDKKKDKDGYESCLTKFWEELRDNIDNITIEDPANPIGNDLSDFFNDIKSLLSSVANKSLNSVVNGNWEEIFGSVEIVNQEYKINAIRQIREKNTETPQPWSN